jgi:hypothetical protein
MNYDREFEEFFGRNTKKMVDAVLYPRHYENEKKMMRLAWDTALKLKDSEYSIPEAGSGIWVRKE